METIKIAIDGPAGAGKTTLSKKLADIFGLVYIDTGAMYRAIALKARRTGCDITNEDDVAQLLFNTQIDILHLSSEQIIMLDGEDVSTEIRDPEISVAASDVATIPAVRLKLVEMQRNIARQHDVIMDGRDIASYVLPHADLKIFLTATLDDRALRRCRELEEHGLPADFETVKRDIKYRDKNDSTRGFAPLMVVPDALIIDTSENSLEESMEILTQIIRERLEDVL